MNVVYENKKAKVLKCGESYDLLTVSTRNEDGIVSTDWNLKCTYGKWYCRSWTGRTFEYRTEHDPLEDAINDAKRIGE